MILFGLTGGIGAGKSTAAVILARHGLPVIDTDDLARELVNPGQPALKEIVAAFGNAVLDQAGALDRAALAQLVFSDAGRRQQLEAILHPRIRQRWLAQVAGWQAANLPFGVVVIPLLFETHAETHFDSIVCTACTAATQRKRLIARGWSDPQIASRLSAQMPLEQKMAAANYVIWTEGALEIHERQLALLLSRFNTPGPPAA